MKKILLSMALLSSFITLVAQAPHSFRYQSVVRNPAGELLADHQVGLKISILKNSPTGLLVFSETYSLLTSAQGLINLSVGTGNPSAGAIENIDWGNGTYFLRMDVDLDGGTNFEFLGTSQLLSVPYALYAETAGNGGDQSELYWNRNGNSLYYNEGNVGIGTTSPIYKLQIEGNEEEWPGRIFLGIRNRSESGKSLAYLKIYAGPGDNGTSLGHISTTYEANEVPQDVQGYGILAASGNGMIISATKPDLSPGVIKFFNGQTPGTKFIESMRISENGNIGIGTTAPAAKIQIADGDVYISDINRGIIMKSPDGQCWRGTINNSGVLEFVDVACP